MLYEGHKLRHELKYYINQSVYQTLRNRLKVVIQPDPNMIDEDGYMISSLYFDDLYQSALSDKQDGYRFRKKFRIRCYNNSDNVIKLECKRKYDEYISKTSADLSREEYNSILAGNYDFLGKRSEEVCRELFVYHHTHLLKPVITVEYLREAYVLSQGSVRITFDKDIAASTGEKDMFSPRYSAKGILEPGLMILEVKFDDFIPAYVLQILKTAMTEKCAISKYVMCRTDNRRILFR